MTVIALLFALLLQRGAANAPAVVTGQLQMPDGSPAAAVRVAAIPAPTAGNRPTDGQNYYAAQVPVSIALSDASGAYRLANVPPGRYYIVAGAVGHATYFPGTSDIEAAGVVTIDAGPVTERADFRLTRSPGTRIRGNVTPPPSGQERAVISGVLLGELLEAPVREDGTFEFGRVPRGSYLLSLYPTPSGMASLPFQVGDQDALSLSLVRPPAWTVSGRVVAERGPVPRALLGFSTARGYVPTPINPDGSFTVRLHAAEHQVEIGGVPVGYALSSVRVGSQPAGRHAITVGGTDVNGVVVTIGAPPTLPRLRGRLRDGRAGTRVVATGPIVGAIETTMQADGSFEFAAVPPGLYRVSLPQETGVAEAQVVVDSARGGDVELLRR